MESTRHLMTFGHWEKAEGIMIEIQYFIRIEIEVEGFTDSPKNGLPTTTYGYGISPHVLCKEKFHNKPPVCV